MKYVGYFVLGISTSTLIIVILPIITSGKIALAMMLLIKGIASTTLWCLMFLGIKCSINSIIEDRP